MNPRQPAPPITVRQRARAAVQAFVRWKATQDAEHDAEGEDLTCTPDEIACANLPRLRLVGARREL